MHPLDWGRSPRPLLKKQGPSGGIPHCSSTPDHTSQEWHAVELACFPCSVQTRLWSNEATARPSSQGSARLWGNADNHLWAEGRDRNNTYSVVFESVSRQCCSSSWVFIDFLSWSSLPPSTEGEGWVGLPSSCLGTDVGLEIFWLCGWGKGRTLKQNCGKCLNFR